MQFGSIITLLSFRSGGSRKKNKKDMFKLDVVATSGQSVGILHTKVVGVFTKTLIVGYGSVKELFVSALPPITTANEIKLVT